MSLDGEQMRLFRKFVPEGSDEETHIRAFAVFCGAAAACATSLWDELDLGRNLSTEERAEWAAINHLLLRLADRYTFGADVQDGEVPQAARKLAEVVG